MDHRDTAAHHLTRHPRLTATKDPVEEPEPDRMINNASTRIVRSRAEISEPESPSVDQGSEDGAGAPYQQVHDQRVRAHHVGDEDRPRGQ